MNGFNFTERARKVFALARDEAEALNHEYVGTEHILLGLIREGEGVAVRALKNLDADPNKIRLQINEIVRKGQSPPTDPDLPYTSRAKRVIELAMDEAEALNHRTAGTQHLLLGLLLEKQGIAAQVLNSFGISAVGARAEILSLLGQGAPEPAVHGAIRFQSRYSRTVEIQSYNLRPGSQAEFHGIMFNEAVPMMMRHGLDVVTCAQSLHDDHSYYLITAYLDGSDRLESQSAFFGSDEWQSGPRERMLAAVESYTSVVIEMHQEAVNSLRTL